MKSFLVLLLVSPVVLVCGTYFGWWSPPIPVLSSMTTYEQRKNINEEARNVKRRRAGLDTTDSQGQLDNDDAKRRSEALRTGGGIN